MNYEQGQTVWPETRVVQDRTCRYYQQEKTLNFVIRGRESVWWLYVFNRFIKPVEFRKSLVYLLLNYLTRNRASVLALMIVQEIITSSIKSSVTVYFINDCFVSRQQVAGRIIILYNSKMVKVNLIHFVITYKPHHSNVWGSGGKFPPFRIKTDNKSFENVHIFKR
jgi:hypothetical protein